MNKTVYAVVCGESSGDLLGAGLMSAIIKRDPNASFIGIFGPKMREVAGKAGVTSKQLFDMEQLSVMGIGEVIKALPRILSIRKKLIQSLLKNKPTVYIGIDAPDFNLTVESVLKKNNVPTVHYVSPSVWAWRTKRIFKIKEATNMVLSILPFEKAFYDKYNVPCTYVGHRLAKEIDSSEQSYSARMYLGFQTLKSTQVVCVFPGSRVQEIKYLTPVFACAAYKLQMTYPQMRFVCATPTRKKAELIKSLWIRYAPNIPLTIWVGMSREVMMASNALMIASGTATLEAMLLKRPMVVCYILNALTAIIARRALQVDCYSLPNLISGKRLVPELMQEDCTSDNIYEEISNIFNSNDIELYQEFDRIHKEMSIDSDRLAADAVFKVIIEHYQKNSK